MALNAVFLCDKTWHIQAFMQCSPELPLEKGMDLTVITEQGQSLLSDFGPRCRLELTFPQWSISACALIRAYPQGNLVLITTDQVASESMRVAEVYEDAVEWARDRMDGLFRSEYYMIQQLNNQLVDSKRALARSNSQLHRALEEVEHTNQELVAAQESVQRALQAAERADRSKTNFLASVSHDIRTPMNAIVGFISLLEPAGNLTEEQKCYLHKMRTSSQHLLGLINDVLEISKIETGEIVLDAKPLSLTSQVEWVDTVIRPQAKAKEQRFLVDAEKLNHHNFIGDDVRLRQILMNLLSNAVKYTPNGGEIRLEIAEGPSHKAGCAAVWISVSDNGCGMSPEFAKRVFEPFVRDKRVSEIQGTGLGMAITKNIVKLMGGTISVQSELNRGSRFTVSLELPIDGGAAEKELPKEQANVSDAVLKGKRFLCAEDNELNKEILEALLQMNGASCMICSNGKEILKVFSQVRPGEYDAILMDVQMPVMNGLEATRAIRASRNPLGKTIPIIAMTANAFTEDIQNCLDAGMDAHVSKPLEIAVLERTLQAVWNGKFSITRQ